MSPVLTTEPATTHEQSVINGFAEQLSYDELLDAHEHAAVACGYTKTYTDSEGHEVVFADRNAWGAAGARGYTRREASALIKEMRAITAQGEFAPCYCGASGEKRGAPCRTVHYYDGHFDYECGLS